MRPEVNSNRFEISLRGEISLRCKVNFYNILIFNDYVIFSINITTMIALRLQEKRLRWQRS